MKLSHDRETAARERKGSNLVDGRRITKWTRSEAIERSEGNGATESDYVRQKTVG